MRFDPNDKVAEMTAAQFTKLMWRAMATAPRKSGRGGVVPLSEAVRLTGKSKKTLYNMRRAGTLTSYTADGQRRALNAGTPLFLSLDELDAAGLLGERAVQEQLIGIP